MKPDHGNQGRSRMQRDNDSNSCPNAIPRHLKRSPYKYEHQGTTDVMGKEDKSTRNILRRSCRSTKMHAGMYVLADRT